MTFRFSMFLLVLLALLPLPANAQESGSKVAWRLLDYIAVDYSAAVSDGKVVSEAEYAEMLEFSRSVRGRVSELPPAPGKEALLAKTDLLITAIEQKSASQHVASAARILASDLLVTYPTPMAPSSIPDLTRARILYEENCSNCHGLNGRGDGVDAKGMEPPPIAFTDLARARQRSAFALYQVITQGLEGTEMKSFSHFSDEERWSLALYAGGFAFGGDAISQGEQFWKDEPGMRQAVPDLETLMQITPDDLVARFGEPAAIAITAYLRHTPSAAVDAGGSSLDVARNKLKAAVIAFRAGKAREAQEFALSAYLDGFESVEGILATRDEPLLRRVEAAMLSMRASINANEPAPEVEAKAAEIEQLLSQAEMALSPSQASPLSTFLGAFTILLREGLEAVLIVVAMLAFLRKTDRRDAIPYVHGGWIFALAAGAVTWVVGTFLISISGASRELTEGFGSLFAAVILISVGVWMHGKAHAEAWQAYIKQKVATALSKGSGWFLFLLAFVVVYREVFETILFYAALWSQGTELALIGGAVTAVLVLASVTWALLVYSRRLPISKFFGYSALLIAALSIVLAGKGVAALQEAGLISVHTLNGAPRIDIVGLHPTWEGIGAQAVVVLSLIVGFWMAGRPKAPDVI